MDQQKIFRELIAQIAIVCGVTGAYQTTTFQEKGSVHSLSHLFNSSTDKSPMLKFNQASVSTDPISFDDTNKFKTLTLSVKVNKAVQTTRQTTDIEKSLNSLLAKCT